MSNQRERLIGKVLGVFAVETPGGYEQGKRLFQRIDLPSALSTLYIAGGMIRQGQHNQDAYRLALENLIREVDEAQLTWKDLED